MLMPAALSSSSLKAFAGLFARRRDRIVVLGGGSRTADLIRLAVVRSDEVVLVGTGLDATARAAARRHGVDVTDTPVDRFDLSTADAVLIDLADASANTRAARRAKRHGVPAHVADEALQSDFTLIQFLELAPESRRA